MLRRQKHTLSQSTTPFVCTLFFSPYICSTCVGGYENSVITEKTEELSGMFRRSASLALPHLQKFRRDTVRVPTLSFHSLLFLFYQGKNLKFTKDFLSLPNPQNPWKRQRKYQNNQGNSLLKINQGNPKNQGMEGQGSASWPHESQRFLAT